MEGTLAAVNTAAERKDKNKRNRHYGVCVVNIMNYRIHKIEFNSVNCFIAFPSSCKYTIKRASQKYSLTQMSWKNPVHGG